MPEARDAVPSMRTQDPSDSEKRDIDQATLANNLWEMLHLRQNGNAGLPIGTGQASKQEDGPARMGYYQEHGPRRFGEQEKRQPTMEERFWQFTPDVPESEDSDDSAEERELVSYLQLNLLLSKVHMHASCRGQFCAVFCLGRIENSFQSADQRAVLSVGIKKQPLTVLKEDLQLHCLQVETSARTAGKGN